MKLYHFMCVSVLLVLIPLSAEAGLVTGPSARATFEKYRDSHLDMFIDFEGIATGPHSTLPIGPYLTGHRKFNLATTTFRWPRPIVDAPPGTPVILLPYDYVQTSPDNNRLMGAVKVSRDPGYIPDGQSKYEIVFAHCQERVGLLRIFNTYSTTSFYHFDKTVTTHRNTSAQEFVGYIGDHSGKCIKRVVFDGHYIEQEYQGELIKFYQVGCVDDLFYSFPAVHIDIILPQPPVVVPGNDLVFRLYVMNFGDYDIRNPTINVRYRDHNTNEIVTITRHPDLNRESAIYENFTIQTEKNTTHGQYQIDAEFSSSSGGPYNNVQTDAFYHVGKITAKGWLPAIMKGTLLNATQEQ